MVDFVLSQVTGDIDITNFRMTLTSTEEQLIRQRLQITLSTYKGEWFANSNFGVPYLENSGERSVLSKTALTVLDFEIKKAILDTEGVLAIAEYESELDYVNRIATIRFSVMTETGAIVESSLTV